VLRRPDRAAAAAQTSAALDVSAGGLLTVEQVAARLEYCAETVRRRIRAGEIAAFRDRGIVRVSEHELARYIESRTTQLPAVSRGQRNRVGRDARAPLPAGRRVHKLFDEPDPLPPAA